MQLKNQKFKHKFDLEIIAPLLSLLLLSSSMDAIHQFFELHSIPPS